MSTKIFVKPKGFSSQISSVNFKFASGNQISQQKTAEITGRDNDGQGVVEATPEQMGMLCTIKCLDVNGQELASVDNIKFSDQPKLVEIKGNNLGQSLAFQYTQVVFQDLEGLDDQYLNANQGNGEENPVEIEEQQDAQRVSTDEEYKAFEYGQNQGIFQDDQPYGPNLIYDLTTKFAQEEQKLENQNKQKVEDMKQKVVLGQETLTQKSDTLQKLNEKNQKLRTQITTQENELVKKEEDIADLSSDAQKRQEEIREQISQYIAQAFELNSKLEQKKRKKMEKDERIQQLTDEKNQLDAKRQNLDEKVKTYQNIFKQIHRNCTSELQKIKTDLDISKKDLKQELLIIDKQSERDFKKMMEKHAMVKQDIQKVQNEKANIEHDQQVLRMQIQLGQEQNSLTQKQVDQQNAEIKALKELQETQKQLKNQSTELQKKILSAENGLSDLLLKQKTFTVQKTAKETELQERQDAMKQESEALAEREKQNVDDQKERIDKLEVQVDKKRVQKGQNEKRLEKLRQEKEKVDKENEESIRTEDATIKNIRYLDVQLETTKDQLKKSQSEFNSDKQKNVQVQQQFRNMTIVATFFFFMFFTISQQS